VNQPTPSPLGTFVVACGGVMLVSLDATLAVPIFPALRDAFAGSSVQALSWVLNAYTIVYAALLAPAGRLSDLYGARRCFLAGALLFTLASALCAVAFDPVSLSLFRALQAAGGALMTPSALSLVLATFPSERRAAMVGAFSAAGALAAALGPSIGAALIEIGGWRFAFLANVPFGAAVAWSVFRRREEAKERGTTGALDLVGIALLIGGMALLTGGVIRVEEGAEAALGTVLLIVMGLVVMLAYGRHARKRPDAPVDLQLFAIPDYLRASIATFVFGVGFSLLFLHSFLFLVEIWRFPPPLAGLAVIPGPLMVIPTVVLAGRLSALSQRQRAIAGAALLAATQVWMALLVEETPRYWALLFPIQLLGGMAVGLVLPALTALAVAHLPAERFGVGGAVNNAVRQFGGVIGTAIAVILIGKSGAGLAAFQASWVLMAAISASVALISLRFMQPGRTAGAT